MTARNNGPLTPTQRQISRNKSVSTEVRVRCELLLLIDCYISFNSVETCVLPDLHLVTKSRTQLNPDPQLRKTRENGRRTVEDKVEKPAVWSPTGKSGAVTEVSRAEK